MNIVFMNGGLGNQTFQYIYLRYLELQTGQTCIIDDSPFFGPRVPHNGYELEKVFGIRHQRLSQLFDRDVWDYMVSRRDSVAGIAQELLNGGMPLCMIYDTKNYRFNGDVFAIDQVPPDLSVHFPNIYYHGYWLGNVYFIQTESILRNELTFPSLSAGSDAAGIQNSITASPDPVCIHVRRGDMAQLGWCQGPEYYADAIAHFADRHPSADYFLFSDDPDWCLANQHAMGFDSISTHLCTVTGNNSSDAWIDLMLMTECHHFIADRSSFSLLAWMLCKYPEKELIANYG